MADNLALNLDMTLVYFKNSKNNGKYTFFFITFFTISSLFPTACTKSQEII